MGQHGRVPVYDVVGIGFGPAGIALAAAIEDAEEEADAGTPGWHALFLEQAADSAWQPELLLPATDIQHHYLRDFATPRNPRSRFTFPNYLKEKGRLFHFGLLGGAPGRIEWSDYVQWVAEQVAHRVLYRHRVETVEPVEPDDGRPIELIRVRARDLERDEPREYLARNVVVATGRKPYLPSVYQSVEGPRLFHPSQFLSRVRDLDPGERPTFAIVGSGETAIEIILYIAERFRDSEIYSIHRGFGFALADLGHFTNEVFFPDVVDYFYSLSPKDRERFFERIRRTNYAAVDWDVSGALYWKVYEDWVQGIRRIHVLRSLEVSRVVPVDERYKLVLEDVYKGDHRFVTADVVIPCMGFTEPGFPEVLEPLRPYLTRSDADELDVTRDYRVPADERLRAGVFLSGIVERTHGISDSTSFTMTALKAQTVLDALAARRREQTPAGVGTGQGGGK